MIRLVASDMDGTLLGPDGTISDRTAEVIRRLQKQHVIFTVCTGRSYEDARRPLAEQGLSCDLICMNGAAIYDKSGRCIRNSELQSGQIQFVMECCRGDVVYDFMTDQGSCTLTPREQFQKYLETGVMLAMLEQRNVPQLLSRFTFLTRSELLNGERHIYKISVVHPNPFVLEEIRTRIAQSDAFSVASSHHTNLEITGCEAKKGLALLHYAQMKGIRSREIMALGDSENDLSMLSLPLGYTIAMENATETVRRTARCQTRSNAEDGAAYAIETLVLEPEQQAC